MKRHSNTPFGINPGRDKGADYVLVCWVLARGRAALRYVVYAYAFHGETSEDLVAVALLIPFLSIIRHPIHLHQTKPSSVVNEVHIECVPTMVLHQLEHRVD